MIVVVVPAFNEAASIGPVVQGLFKHGFTSVVVVDDGSSDDTARLAAEAGAVVLRHPINRGQGAALETGNEFARRQGADFVVHFDADRQFNPADIAPALKALQEKKIAVLLGSRFLDDRSKIPFFKKTFLLPVARFINRIMTGLVLTDGQNGFRILSKEALRVISIKQDGMAHNTEIMHQVGAHKLSYIEFPVEVTYHEYGQRFFGGVKIVADLTKATFLK